MYKCEIIDDLDNIFEKKFETYEDAIEFVKEVENNYKVVSYSLFKID